MKLGTGIISIDVTQIDKSAIFTADNGKKYLDLVYFLDGEPDQYGQHGMVVQGLSKERRESGEKGNILGNIKQWWPERQEQAPPPPPQQQAQAVPPVSDEVTDDSQDIPF